MKELRPGDPQQVGSYRLLGRLGSGGMGQVFLGQSPGGRLVAVKVIRPELADGPEFRRRFAREVAAARQVSGIFTTPVVDADPDAPEPWLVTAYVDGPSLADYVKRNGALPAGDTIALSCGLAEGLSAIHAAGIVHRDLKPSNVLLASDGPRIIDFGISRAAETTSLTQTGLVVGSPGFMSPEQARGLEVSAASDVFSLGAVLAFAATGTDPFGTGEASALLYRVVHGEPSLGGIPAEIRDVILACLRKDPAERPTPAGLLTMMALLKERRRPLPLNEVRASTRRPAPVSADYLPPPGPSSQPAVPPGGPGPATPAPTIMRSPALAADTTAHRPRWPWIAAVAAVAIAAGTGVALAAHDHFASTPQSPGVSQAAARAHSPRAVVTAYFAAINAHDWRKVWQLGGKNLSSSYASMVTGFQDTSRDVITQMTADGDAVAVQIRAYETTGAVQVYALSYTVSGGIIASGQQTLISTQAPCPHIRYAADGAAGPLFCPGGQPNPPVLAYYRALHLRVLSLGPGATSARVLRAMCADVHQHVAYRVEADAYYLARRINGWSFSTSPAHQMRDGACK